EKQWIKRQTNINKKKGVPLYCWHSFFSFKNGIRMCGENATPSILKEYDRSKTPLRRSEKNMSDRKCSSVDLKRICPIENAAPSIRKEYERSKTLLRRSEKNMHDRKRHSIDLKRICPIENAAPSIRKEYK